MLSDSAIYEPLSRGRELRQNIREILYQSCNSYALSWSWARYYYYYNYKLYFFVCLFHSFIKVLYFDPNFGGPTFKCRKTTFEVHYSRSNLVRVNETRNYKSITSWNRWCVVNGGNGTMWLHENGEPTYRAKSRSFGRFRWNCLRFTSIRSFTMPIRSFFRH